MAIPSGMTVGELEKTNPGMKSTLTSWWERNKDSGIARAKLHVASAGQGARAGGEALLVGGMLGAAHAMLECGLDVKVHGHGIPVDAVGGALAIVASVGLAHIEVGSDLRNVGTTALGVFAFRKTHDMAREIKLKKKGIVDEVAFTQTAGGKLPVGSGAAISKMHGEGDSSRAQGWGTGFFGADSGAEDPVIRAARYL